MIYISSFLRKFLGIVIVGFSILFVIGMLLIISILALLERLAKHIKKALFLVPIKVEIPQIAGYYSVWITSIGPEKIKIIKLLREQYQDALPLADTSSTINQLPVLYFQSLDKELVEQQAKKLIQLRASFIIKGEDSVIFSNT
jgi:hypothetical protein